MSGAAIAATVAAAIIGLTAIAAVGACLGAGRQRRQAEHARRVIAARAAVRAALAGRAAEPGAMRLDGTHEACELTNQEWGAVEYLSRRYPSLGKEVTR